MVYFHVLIHTDVEGGEESKTFPLCIKETNGARLGDFQVGVSSY